MQQLNEFLKSANYVVVFNLAIAFVGSTIGIVLVIVLLHTLQLIGQKTILYRRKEPRPGWNRRFYTGGFVMIIFLLGLMWLLSVWSHKSAPQ